MKKILGLLGGLSLLASGGSTVISCGSPYTFNLTTSIGEIIDTFDKRSVEDYYLDSFFTIDDDTTGIVINFKTTGLKNYGDRSGRSDYWLKQLVMGLGLKPEQAKYGKEEVPQWVWESADLWDYETNSPKI